MLIAGGSMHAAYLNQTGGCEGLGGLAGLRPQGLEVVGSRRSSHASC